MRYFSIILGVGELFLRITENGYISLRELEDQCKVNLRFMWISNTYISMAPSLKQMRINTPGYGKINRKKQQLPHRIP